MSDRCTGEMVPLLKASSSTMPMTETHTYRVKVVNFLYAQAPWAIPTLSKIFGTTETKGSSGAVTNGSQGCSRTMGGALDLGLLITSKRQEAATMSPS
jgi:hypothetical protein